ncbi:hypothetical protein BRADI_3g55050v3 [Brachypodium distachyon]|uniref:Knottin scorpion toxin-like domain-containing protein n=1 Tax=Brachypodium distachyon TaxID=15368 RepID=I1IDS9_BRADI|nr:hypothetical protein BRADI_3g55050v3 [Brachypodium distachyon]
MAARSASVLVLALLVISCCHCRASRDAPGDLKTEEKEAVRRPMADPSCFLFKGQMCTVESCTDHCLMVGLGTDVGFCSFRANEMQMYCCCPIPDPLKRPARPMT